MTNSSQTLAFLNETSLAFPSHQQALTDPNGLLAFGGDLSSKRLVEAYTNGIFPWFAEGEPIMWWSPNPRAIIPVDDIKINRTLRKVINRQMFQVSINTAFEEVIDLCADAPFRQEDTWIVDEMLCAYKQLHKQGFAHSIEVWQNQELVGGLYGVAINGFFSGESMFYSQPNASKIALVALIGLLKQQSIDFIDCQLTNPFLESMGCIEIPREQFLLLKEQALAKYIDSSLWQPRML